MPTKTQPAPTTPPDYTSKKWVAYIDRQGTEQQLKDWQDQARTTPFTPSNGDILKKVVKFAKAKRFNPAK